MTNKAILVLPSLLSVLLSSLQAQTPGGIVRKLSGHIRAVWSFGKMLPREKIYLYFDNTGYYQGDPVWFQCYVVTSELNHPSDLSKTLYVELLGPGGEVITKHVLPIRSGHCHDSFRLTQLPFYSGFYEVRTYTKYMLNFGGEIIFSRILPVFNKPRTAGDFKEENVQKYAVYRYPQVRKKTTKERKVNPEFFPEGGSSVEGVPSRVAFKATDAYRDPIALSGAVINRKKKKIAFFATIHEGRGTFVYTPTDGEDHKAEMELNRKKYRFGLPEARLQRHALQVDNLSLEDNIVVSVQKNPHTSELVLGLTMLGHEKPFNYYLLNIRKSTPVSFEPDRAERRVGMTQIVLSNTVGQIIADRLAFVRKPEPLTISVRKNREGYQPLDRVLLDFSVRDTTGKPAFTSVSISACDGWEEVESRHSMLADLLLTSETKGYAHRPLHYLEVDDREHRTALDHLLLVQGWRYYAWKYEPEVELFELKYMSEQGIEMHR